MNIAQKLQWLLSSRGMSRSALARGIGVHTSTVTNWLGGKDVKAENLAALCSFFGCTMDDLTGGEAAASSGEHAIDWVDSELREYLEELRTRPEKRLLFSVTKNATREQIEAIVHMVEAMQGCG